ncbi:MAG: class I SAM-dependent methyltransferase [Planctomycetaceae bacterium]
MNLTGTPAEILATLQDGKVKRALDAVGSTIEPTKNQIDRHEAAALFVLAAKCDGYESHILELGTCYGYSAAVMAEAAPKANITTLTPSAKHFSYAEQALRYWPNVRPLKLRSWDYLSIYSGPLLDLVFVDGYHGMVVWDLPWWQWLKAGGLMVFHDYSPKRATRGCQPVYETLTAVKDAFRDFDVKVITDAGQGFVGWYRKQGETLPALDEARYSWKYDEACRNWIPGVP